MNNRRFIRPIFLSVTILLSACTAIPPDTVKLSSTIGDQIVAIEKSHKSFLNQTYDTLEANANKLIDEVYTPKLISAALNGKSGKMLMDALASAKTDPTADATAQALAYTEEFLKQVKIKVDQERSQLINVIERNRAASLANLDAAYEQVLRGNSTITAYLTSIVKVREAQDQLLSAIGAPGLQDQLAQKASNVSDSIAEITQKANSEDKSLDEVKTEVQKVLSTFK